MGPKMYTIHDFFQAAELIVEPGIEDIPRKQLT